MCAHDKIEAGDAHDAVEFVSIHDAVELVTAHDAVELVVAAHDKVELVVAAHTWARGGWWGDTPMHVVKPYVVTYAVFRLYHPPSRSKNDRCSPMCVGCP